MGTLYITEVEKLSVTLDGGNVVAAPQMPPIAEQHLDIGGTSTPSAVFNRLTRFVMVETDAPCSLAWAAADAPADPVAVATAHRMATNETRFYGVTPGMRLAVISNT